MAELVPQRGSTREASCFGVPYSEHSSFRELTIFCCALRIEKVIPTVNVGSAASRAKIKAWIDRWMSERKKNGVIKLGDGAGEVRWEGFVDRFGKVTLVRWHLQFGTLRRCNNHGPDRFVRLPKQRATKVSIVLRLKVLPLWRFQNELSSLFQLVILHHLCISGTFLQPRHNGSER